MSGVKSKERQEKTLNCLELVGLTRWMEHRPFELSGGQQQRVAIARALANDPKLILADEPTGELDSTTAREILSLFQQIVREQNVTFLIVTHDSLVDDYVDYVLYLKRWTDRHRGGAERARSGRRGQTGACRRRADGR